MKFYSEHEVRKLIEETDIHDGIRGTTSEYLSIMKGIELPDKHGRIVDLDKVLDWLINEDGRFSMATNAKIDNALKNAPVILKASATTPSKNHYCPYYQGVCGLDEDILCYCSSSYETCDTYKEDRRAELEEIKGKQGETSPVWHTGTPSEVGWFLVKYECVCEGRYKGRIGYRAVRRKKDPIDGYIYEDGAINADDVWRPIEWQKIEP